MNGWNPSTMNCIQNISSYPDLRRDVLYTIHGGRVPSFHLMNKYFQAAQPRTTLCYGDEKLMKTIQVPAVLVREVLKQSQTPSRWLHVDVIQSSAQSMSDHGSRMWFTWDDIAAELLWELRPDLWEGARQIEVWAQGPWGRVIRRKTFQGRAWERECMNNMAKPKPLCNHE